MSKKSVFDRSALVFIAVLWVLALSVIGYKQIHSMMNRCPEIKIRLSENQINASLPFTASFENNKVKSWDWNFGDGSAHGTGATVSHIYKSAGKYTLTLTVNGKCTESLALDVAADDHHLPTPVIEGPATAKVGQPVSFKEVSGLGTSWEWSFKEPGTVDSRTQKATYTFSSAGKKTISVTMNGAGKSEVAYFDVDVNEIVTTSQKPVITETQFIIILYQIIDRKKDASIFKDALCGKMNMIAMVNNEKKPFDEFCKQIRNSHHRTIIDNLKLVSDGKQCISKITIQTHQGKWRL